MADSSSEWSPGDGSLAQAKAQLRTTVRRRLRELTAAQRREASERLCDRLRQQEIWRRAGAILGYAPLPDELDISSLIDEAMAAGKTVALPRFDRQTGRYGACVLNRPLSELPVGFLGVREPESDLPDWPLKQLDFFLVPGVAFDRNGRRLGRGRGYYDLLLETAAGIKCGVGFDEQVQAQIPVEAHDVLLDCIVTPGFWLDLRPGRGDDVVG